MYCLRVVEGFIGKLQPRNHEDARKVQLLVPSNLLYSIMRYTCLHIIYIELLLVEKIYHNLKIFCAKKFQNFKK
jgi:hypothetical protein